MSRILVVLLLLAIAVAGLGYYLGWFHFGAERADQKSSISITIDEEKIHKDKEKATEKLKEAGEKVKETIGAGTEKVKEKTSPP